jgi:signal transduction histidine kinase/ActR/RegA family two-component response regulator
LSAVLLAAAPVAVALAIILPATNAAARADVLASRAALARAVAAAADNYVDGNVTNLVTISTRAVIRTPGTNEQIVAELAPVLAANPNWITFGVSDADGWNLSSFTAAPHTVNVSDRDYFKGALETGKPSIGSVILARSTGQKTIIIALPVTFADGRRGVFSGALNVTQVGDQLRDIVGSGIAITLVDEHGTAFVGPDLPKDQLVDLSADRLVQLAAGGATGADLRAAPGGDQLVGYARAATARWGVLLRAPAAVAFAPGDAQLRTSIAVATLAVLTAIGLAWLFGGRLGRETERVDAERRRLADVFNHLPARMALLRGPDLRYELVNPASFDGGTRAGAVLGRPFGEVVPDQRFVALLRDVYASGTPRLLSEVAVPVTDADGMQRTTYFNSAIVPLRDANGEVDAIVYHAVDVTEQVVARAALERARGEASDALDRAEAAARVREDFLSIATHELRTPVTSISGYAQLALRALTGGRTERVQPALETIVRQSERLAILVTQLLDASRIAGGRLTVEPERTDMAALVTSAVDAARLRSERHRWVVDVPPRLQAAVDPLRVEQVLTNLFDNAIRYSPAGGTINVRLDVDGPMLRLAVSDEGLGIPPERIEHVFDRFYRGHEEQGLGGLGLGLYISREIVEQHGGIIDVESTLGRGTSFIVRLPITSRTAVIERSTPEQHAQAPRSLVGTVLLVDDDGDIRRLVREVLREAGLNVVVAENGEEALQLLADLRPRLILLDKLMPVMDGTAFAAAYRQRPNAAPIIALCAARDAAEWATSIGAVGHIGKPFNVEQLIATVAQYIEPERRPARS